MSKDKYCMFYITLSCKVEELKKDLNVKYNYQKDEWFIKINNIDDVSLINDRLKEQKYVSIEGINMDEDEVKEICDLIFSKYFN
jgi:hypothetical protein